MLKKQSPSLKSRALRYLSTREYSVAELRNKLSQYSDDEQQLNQLIQWLQEKNFLNDTRATNSILNQKANNFGLNRLKQQLQSKGIDQQIIDQQLQPLKQQELSRAFAIWQKKFTQFPTDPKQHLKQMRFLAYRGFSADIIKQVFNLAKKQD